MKKTLALGLLLALSLVLLTGCNNKSEEKENNIKIGMITDVGGINDESFNQSAWEGLKKAEKDLGIDVSYIESNQESDYEQNMDTFLDQDLDLILAVGYKLTETVETAAKNNPDKKFAIIDGEFSGKIPSNVKNITFKEEEAGYLAGALAAISSKNGRIGFIGGMEVPVVDRYKYGFLAGVSDAYKELKVDDFNVQTSYANSFTDQAKGKAIANQMINNEAEVIFHAAGPVGNGVFEALKEQDKLGIGVDADQNKLAPDTVISSAVKNLNIASYNIAKEICTDTFVGGKTVINSLSNDGVGLAKYNNKVSSDAVQLVENFKHKIISKDVIVPATKDEYEKYIK